MDHFDYENGFWMTAPAARYGKFIAHYQVYDAITDIPGDLIEFGVHKGNSLVRWLSLRDLLENPTVRKIFGFDIFSEFPEQGIEEFDSDKKFITEFMAEDGVAVNFDVLNKNLSERFTNFELVKGDLRLTVPKWLENFENSGRKFSLIHLDVDVFEPTKFVLDVFCSRLSCGGAFIVDDYGFVEGATSAVDQFLDDQKDQFRLKRLKHVANPVVIKKIC